MKKHNEGYALPFVLVVSIVMSLIAITVMGFAEDNLVAQKKSIQRMEAKYQATGILEQVIAVAESAAGGTVKVPEAMMVIPQIVDGEGFVKLAIAGDSKQEIWLIVALKPSLGSEVTISDYISNENGTLTIKPCTNLEIQKYEIVDEETAKKYVKYEPPTQETTEPTVEQGENGGAQEE